MSAPIKLLTPSMPSADELLPYLRQIDMAKVYVNGGGLVRRLESRCGQLLRLPTAAVSNGTLAIELALRALDLPIEAEAVVPAVTYVATGQAIVNARLVPYVVDVDARRWQLTPSALYAQATRVIVPVAAFGTPVDVEAWETVAEKTGCWIVIDAAGALLQQRPSAHPRVVTCYSLHATKAVGAGEGGLVASSDARLLERVRDLASFGIGGTNAKMSEYHAAVALASLDLDRLEAKRSTSFALEAAYVEHLPRSCTLQAGPMQTHRTILPVLLPPGAWAEPVLWRLHAAGIEAKSWYRPFLHERGEFAPYLQGAFPVAEQLAQRLVGLPFHCYMSEADVERVCAVLSEVIA